MGEAKSISQKRDAEFVKSVAMKYLNAPEVSGGKGPFGICSQGLVNMAFKIAGHQLPWNIQMQSQMGKKVKDLGSAKVGDIAFFKDKKGTIDHAGIIIGENKIIHSFGHVRIDHLNEEGILDAETKIYTHSLASIRRVLN
jgi:cell wall-associated NlpC family hydrolase